MSKVLLIDIGGTNLRYAYSEGDSSSNFMIQTKLNFRVLKGSIHFYKILSKEKM